MLQNLDAAAGIIGRRRRAGIAICDSTKRFHRVVFEQLIHELGAASLPKPLEVFARGFGVEVLQELSAVARRRIVVRESE